MQKTCFLAFSRIFHSFLSKANTFNISGMLFGKVKAWEKKTCLLNAFIVDYIWKLFKFYLWNIFDEINIFRCFFSCKCIQKCSMENSPPSWPFQLMIQCTVPILSNHSVLMECPRDCPHFISHLFCHLQQINYYWPLYKHETFFIACSVCIAHCAMCMFPFVQRMQSAE